MHGGSFEGFELTGGIDDDVCADFAPFEILRVAVAKEGDALAVYDQHAVFIGHVALENAVGGIVFEETCGPFCVRGGVDGDQFHFRIHHSDASDETTDAAESVNTNFNRHDILLKKESLYSLIGYAILMKK